MASTTTTPFVEGRYPDKMLAFYIVLADNNEDGYQDTADWEPKLYDYQQTAANVLFFTFIDPSSMDVPKAFQKLSSSRGTGAEGAVPQHSLIIFAIGGYSYSLDPNPWEWLTTREKAVAMAERVASWPDTYNVDGIDLDIEAGAGDRGEAGINLSHFIRRLRELKPNFIVSQPTYGFPQIKAEIDTINAAWKVDGSKTDAWLDSIGLMVYEGTQSLNYVENYAHATDQWEGFPIHVNVPYPQIMVGCKGSAAETDILTLADESIRQNLLGPMVWFASVQNGLVYDASWDTSLHPEAQKGFQKAYNRMMGISI